MSEYNTLYAAVLPTSTITREEQTNALDQIIATSAQEQISGNTPDSEDKEPKKKEDPETRKRRCVREARPFLKAIAKQEDEELKKKIDNLIEEYITINTPDFRLKINKLLNTKYTDEDLLKVSQKYLETIKEKLKKYIIKSYKKKKREDRLIEIRREIDSFKPLVRRIKLRRKINSFLKLFKGFN